MYLLGACILALGVALPFVKSLVTFGVLCFLLVFLLSNVIRFCVTGWVGMMIFLVYVGGLMVMFGYFLAICPNQKVRFKHWRWVVSGAVFVFGVLSVWGRVPWPIEFSMSPGMNVMFTEAGSPLLCLVAFILFFTLVVVVKVTEARKGPLRPFNVHEKRQRWQQLEKLRKEKLKKEKLKKEGPEKEGSKREELGKEGFKREEPEKKGFKKGGLRRRPLRPMKKGL